MNLYETLMAEPQLHPTFEIGKLATIKAVRAYAHDNGWGIGLKDAKDLVDRVVTSLTSDGILRTLATELERGLKAYRPVMVGDLCWCREWDFQYGDDEPSNVKVVAIVTIGHTAMAYVRPATIVDDYDKQPFAIPFGRLTNDENRAEVGWTQYDQDRHDEALRNA